MKMHQEKIAQTYLPNEKRIALSSLKTTKGLELRIDHFYRSDPDHWVDPNFMYGKLI